MEANQKMEPNQKMEEGAAIYHPSMIRRSIWSIVIVLESYTIGLELDGRVFNLNDPDQVRFISDLPLLFPGLFKFIEPANKLTDYLVVCDFSLLPPFDQSMKLTTEEPVNWSRQNNWN